MLLLYLITGIDFLAALIGLIKRKSFKNRGLKFFPIFLLIQFLDQTLTGRLFHFGANTHMYNLLMVFDTSCFAYLFYHLLEKPNFKRTVIYLTIAFNAFYLIDSFFLKIMVNILPIQDLLWVLIWLFFPYYVFSIFLILPNQKKTSLVKQIFGL
jgi:hypothetical protein